MHTGTKQVTQLTDIKVTMEGCPATNLKMIHAKFAFTNLKAAFNRKAGKRRPQQLFKRDTIRARHHIRDKILNLFGIEYVTSNNHVMHRPRQSIRSLFAIQSCMLDFPYNRAILAVLNMKLFPFLPLKYTGIHQQIPQFSSRQRLAGQTREMPLGTSFMLLVSGGTYKNPGLIQPAAKVRRNFTNVVLASCLKAVKKFAVTAIPFIECPCKYTNAVLHRARNLFKSYIGFLAIDNIVRNTGFFAASRVISPILWKIHIAVEETLKIIRHIGDVNSNNTIVCLAG